MVNVFGFFKFNGKKSNKNYDSPTTSNVSVLKVDSSKESTFKSGVTLLSTPKCSMLMFQIKEACGVSDKYFSDYYLPLIHSVAERVQDLGASSEHHHSHKYGLLEHILEVALYAVRYSYGKNYFPDGDEEKIQKLQPVFLYAVFVGGMLHDVGKCITDVRWQIKVNDEWYEWNCLAFDIPLESDCVEYRVKRNQHQNKNCYIKETHELFASALFQDLVPKIGIKWIMLSRSSLTPWLLTHLIHTISSDYKKGSIIGECVEFADRESVKLDMERRPVSGVMVASALGESTPKHKLCLTVIQEILTNPEHFHLSINNRHKGGKPSHVERCGDMLFLSAKFFATLINNKLKDESLTVLNEQTIYTVLTDNKIAKLSPTENTLWWLGFGIDEKLAKEANKKDLSYLAIDTSFFSSSSIDGIPNLIDEGVYPFISGGSQPKERKKQGSLIHLERSDSPEVYDLIYGVDSATSDSLPNDSNEALDSIIDSQNKDSENCNIDLSLNFSEEPKESNLMINESDNDDLMNFSIGFDVSEVIENKEDKEDKEESCGLIKLSDINVSGNNVFGDEPETKKKKKKKKKKLDTKNVSEKIIENNEPPQNLDGNKQIISPEEMSELLDIKKNNLIPEWLTLPDNGLREKRKAINTKDIIEKIIPWFEQEINANNIEFNRNSSPIHFTKYGLFLVVPLIYDYMPQENKKAWKLILKRSSVIYKANGEFAIPMQVGASNAENKSFVYGLLLEGLELKHKGVIAPFNEVLSLPKDYVDPRSIKKTGLDEVIKTANGEELDHVKLKANSSIRTLNFDNGSQLIDLEKSLANISASKLFEK